MKRVILSKDSIALPIGVDWTDGIMLSQARDDGAYPDDLICVAPDQVDALIDALKAARRSISPSQRAGRTITWVSEFNAEDPRPVYMDDFNGSVVTRQEAEKRSKLKAYQQHPAAVVRASLGLDGSESEAQPDPSCASAESPHPAPPSDESHQPARPAGHVDGLTMPKSHPIFHP